MFDRLSQNARQAMALARAAAASQAAAEIEVDHLLIGLLSHEAGAARSLLADLGVDVAALLEALETLLPQGDHDGDTLAFSDESKRALQQAAAAAARRGDSHVGTRHILIGVVCDAENDAARVLARVGVDAETLDRAMTEAPDERERPRRQLLLISNSTMHGGGYLEHCRSELEAFLGDRKTVLFVPFALHDHDGYADKARAAFDAMGHDLVSAHTFDDKSRAVADADAVFVGGGNTFRLLAALQSNGMLDAIRDRARAGMPYIGSSAGTNVATLSIRTTNDMPIVQPPSFDALQLVPFQINPHYLDPDPASSHMGETREERILQFHEEHDVPVLGLREGCMLRVDGATMTLRGTTGARLLRRDAAPEEFTPPCDLSFLLED